MNLHRLRLSAWSERVYVKYHRPYCTFLGYIPGFGPPGALKSAIYWRFSIDFCRIRAPMRGHRKMVCFSHISPHGRSKLDAAIGKQSRRSIDAKRSLSECSMDHPSTVRSEERWDRTFMKTYDVVGDILDTLFLTTLTSAVYANSSFQQL